ncbi:MAG: HAD family phosphatase [Planctomycetales bacterium]|nr:HAD family phosphatase [Planctomycetales bacterium]
MPQQAVIFDVDGVLVDSYQPHFQSWRQMLAEQGFEFTEAQFRATFGRTTRDIIRQLCGDQFPDQRVQAFDERKEALYRESVRHNFPAVDGAVELIDALAATGFAMAVGSSGPTENVTLTLDCLGRADSFAARVTGSDVTRGKPDPQVFLMAAERLGVDPQHCAVVEDAPAGVEAANRAHMLSIALTGTATRAQLAHADLIVDSLRELTPSTITQLLHHRST